MPAPIRLIFLLAIILWQTLPMLSPSTTMDQDDRMGHSAFHWNNEIYGVEKTRVHVGDTATPAQHSHGDGEFNKAGIFSTLWMPVNSGQFTQPRSDGMLFLQSIYLDGPLRPPQQST